ncbi:MAG: hypothetical protein ACFFBD_14610, partial [Candidatus Hodarchaeota archaeon]
MALDIIRILLTIGLGIISVFLGLIILRKSPKEALNQLFCLSFLFLGTFFSAQLPLFILGSLGADAIPLLPFLNLCRDISNASGIFGAATMLLVSLVASRGTELLENRVFLVLYAGIITILAIIGQLNDHVNIDVANATHFLTQNMLGILLCFILPLLLFTGATLRFGVLWYTLEDSVLKKNILFFFLGMCIIVAGLFYQVGVTALFGNQFF